MNLREIKLTNFRNYEFQDLKFSPHLNLITGLNGMGKTNLLDAIYYLCMGKSYFQQTDKNVLRKGEAFFRLEGDFIFGKKLKITVKVVPGEQKTIEKNDSPYTKISDHVGLIPIVFMVPDDTFLALEGSEERRRFLDNTLCQIDHQYLDNLIAYNKLLERRNAVLKTSTETANFNYLLLETLTQQIEPFCQFIHEKRSSFIQDFKPLFNEYYARISGDSETVECLYKSQLESTNFGELMAKNLERDRFLMRTSHGVHKDDLVFLLKELPLKKFASQGQLKSFVIALKLAQWEVLRLKKQKKPILLLDDLFDKLDDRRVALLLEMLSHDHYGQVFITDTHPERAATMAATFKGEYEKFSIENGKVVL